MEKILSIQSDHDINNKKDQKVEIWSECVIKAITKTPSASESAVTAATVTAIAIAIQSSVSDFSRLYYYTCETYQKCAFSM